MVIWNVISPSTFCRGMLIMFIHLCHAFRNAIKNGRKNGKITLTFYG